MTSFVGKSRKLNESRDTSISIYCKSTRKKIDELEKITSLILETLSTSINLSPEISEKELKVSSSIQNGVEYFLSILIKF